MACVTFEDLLQDIGGFGKYQKCLICFFLVPSTIVITSLTVTSLFWTSTPDHWCYVPEVAHSNLSAEVQKQLIRPPRDGYCSMYDIDYAALITSGNWTVEPNSPRKRCDQGWFYDKTDYDATVVTRWNLVCEDDYYPTLILTLGSAGIFAGSPLFGYMTDRFGRKPVFFFLAILIAVTDITSVLSPFFSLLLLLQFMHGLGLMTIYMNVFILSLEFVSPDKRARVNIMLTLAWTCGLCLVPLITWLARDWLYMSIITSLSSGLLCLYWKVLPESPRGLISQRRYQEAHDILSKVSMHNSKRIHKTSYLMERIEEVGEELKNEDSRNQDKPLDLVRSPRMRMRFMLISMSWLCCFVPYYGLQINVRNLAGNQFLNYFYISAVEVPANITSWILMEKVGRRWAAISGFGLSTAANILPVIFSEGYQTLEVVAGLVGKTGATAANGAIFMMAPELFPTSLRAVGLGICSTIGMGSILISPYIVYTAKYGPIIPYICFTVFSMGGIVTVLFQDEAMGHELPQTVADVEAFLPDESCYTSKRPSDTGRSNNSSNVKSLEEEKGTNL